jgi:hypothetical protein
MVRTIHVLSKESRRVMIKEIIMYICKIIAMYQLTHNGANAEAGGHPLEKNTLINVITSIQSTNE